MGVVVALDQLLADRSVWRGRAPARSTPATHPTGVDALDAVLPFGGWPPSSMSEVLTAHDGIGELSLVLPTLARLTQLRQSIVVVGPPYLPYAPGWTLKGVDLDHLLVVRATGKEALWAAEQCLRSGACAAVLCWPQEATDKSLRRLQVAAETGKALGFALRSTRALSNASPAALRLQVESQPRRVRVIKCRGATPLARSIPLPPFSIH